MRVLWLAAVLVAAAAHGQDNELQAVKVAKPPVIDGVINAEEWAGVPSARGSFDEATGAKATDDTEFWLAYDATYVYFAARAHDSQPDAVRATEYRTNVSLSGDDHVTLALDLSGSLADFNAFGMNARGATSISLAGGRAAKREWSGEFVAQGRKTAEGWEVEARIPWRIMRLPAAGPRTVRFNVNRVNPRTQRETVWQYTGGGQVERAGKWLAVEIPAAPSERALKLLPYTYVGEDDEGAVVNAGLDMKTNLAEQVVAVGSINPDFRNIENAILSLDFSRFERLAGETRPFFQEGSQYFNSALFASQRISGFDAGLNVHGRLNDRMSFGALDTVDFGNQNSFVGNFTYDPNPKDSWRVTASSLTRPGLENNGYLARYNRVLGPYGVFLRTMGTGDTEIGKGVYNTAILSYAKNGFSTQAGWDAISPDFVPRLGFAPERDYKGFTSVTEYEGLVKNGPLRSVSGSLLWQDLDRFNGGFYRKTLALDGAALGRDSVRLSASLFLEDFLGVYDRLYGVGVNYPSGDPYRNVGLRYDWGRIQTVDYHSLSLQTAYRPVERLQVTGSYQHVDYGGAADLGILGLNWDIGRDQYVSGRIVKRDRDWNGYLAFRKSGNRGVEYFLILGDPNAERFRTSLILKVVWPFEVGG